MAKLATFAFGTFGIASAAWSGGWYYGKGEIQAALDAEIATLAEQGVAASYRSLEISGFPFGYQGRLTEPKTQAIAMMGRVPTRADWQAPWITFDATVGDLGVVNFKMSEEQSIKLTPVNGGPELDLEIRARDLTGKLEQAGERVTANIRGNTIEISGTSQAIIAPVVINADNVVLSGSAPMEEPGQISTYADLTGITANDGVWDFVDPGKRFPRDRANLRLAAKAETEIRSDDSLALQNLNIEHVGANIAGVSVVGEGQATVQDRRPDGALNLSFSGLGGFFDNAVAAGYFPQQQATIYRMMLNSFAKKGATEGEQVFTVGFKGGYIFVNNQPTFVPAPLLP